MDLPEPWVCQTTPALPLLSTAWTVLPTALVTAKYWCGLAMRLAEPVRALIERGEVADQLQEPVLVVEALQCRLQRSHGLAVLHVPRRDGHAVVVDVPRGEVVEGSERRAVLGLDPVGGEREDAEAERHGELAQVGLQLGVRGGDVGGGAAGLLQFDDAHRHAVAVEHDVEAAFVVALHQGDLVDGEPVVLVRVRAEQVDGGVGLVAVRVDVAEPVAVHEVVVDAVVLGDGVLGLGRGDLGEGLLQVLARNRRVEPLQGGEQPGPDQQLVPGIPLAAAGRDVLPAMSAASRAARPRAPAPCLPSRLRKRLLRVLLSRWFPLMDRM